MWNSNGSFSNLSKFALCLALSKAISTGKSNNIVKSGAEEDPKRIKIVDSSLNFQEVKDQVVYIVTQFLNE